MWFFCFFFYLHFLLLILKPTKPSKKQLGKTKQKMCKKNNTNTKNKIRRQRRKGKKKRNFQWIPSSFGSMQRLNKPFPISFRHEIILLEHTKKKKHWNSACIMHTLADSFMLCFFLYNQPAEFEPNERTWFKMENEWPYQMKFHPNRTIRDQMCENLKCNWVKSIDRYDNNRAANRLTSQQQSRFNCVYTFNCEWLWGQPSYSQYT